MHKKGFFGKDWRQGRKMCAFKSTMGLGRTERAKILNLKLVLVAGAQANAGGLVLVFSHL